jgi:DNA modification methylase
MDTEQVITPNYALYHGDCVEMLRQIPTASVHLTVYSPPFCGLYQYSSDPRDFSNCDDYDKFFEQYEYLTSELHRVTLPGRISAVHCMDVPRSNSGCDDLIDFPGDIIRMHERLGFRYIGRHSVWKEPLAVRNRTMQKNLAHKTIVEDSSLCGCASADYLLLFRRDGENSIPVAHPIGLMEYAGERIPPSDILRFRGWKGKQTDNRFSHWIWRQYASAFWDDVRLDRVLPHREAREEEDEKHVHPLQLDVIERVITLRTNPGETVLTPFMGVGSEVYGSVRMGRKAIGAELKLSYFKQAVMNCKSAEDEAITERELPFETPQESEMG